MEIKYIGEPLDLKTALAFQDELINFCTREDGSIDWQLYPIYKRIITIKYFSTLDTSQLNIEKLYQLSYGLNNMGTFFNEVNHSKQYIDLVEGIDKTLEAIDHRSNKSIADNFIDNLNELVKTMESNYSQKEMIDFVHAITKNEKLGTLSDIDIINKIVESRKAQEISSNGSTNTEKES